MRYAAPKYVMGGKDGERYLGLGCRKNEKKAYLITEEKVRTLFVSPFISFFFFFFHAGPFHIPERAISPGRERERIKKTLLFPFGAIYRFSGYEMRGKGRVGGSRERERHSELTF